MFTNRKLVLYSLLIQFFVAGALACMCERNSLQKSFCQADLVIIGKYVGMKAGPRNGVDRYSFEIKKIYRTNQLGYRLVVGHRVDIMVSQICNIASPKLYEKLIIFARKQSGEFVTSLCDGTQLLSLIPRRNRAAMTNTYQNGCDCVHMMGHPSSGLDCKHKYSFVKKEHGVCKWIDTNSYVLCKMGRPVLDYD